MKYYNEKELEHFLKDGFKMYDDYDGGYLRIAVKDDKYRVGNAKAGSYTITIPDEIDCKQAFELVSRMLFWKGIAQKELMEIHFLIEMSITEPPSKDNS